MSEEVYNSHKVSFDKRSGEWIAEDADRNEVERDSRYKELLKKIDKRKKVSIKPFGAWRMDYKRIFPTKVTSVVSNTLGYMGHCQVWHSDDKGRGKVSAEAIYLATDDNLPIISELKIIDRQIEQLENKRDEKRKKLVSLRAMIADEKCMELVVVQIRKFLGA